MQLRNVDKLECFLSSRTAMKCDHRCGVRNPSTQISQSISISTVKQINKSEGIKRPFPIEMLEIPLDPECNTYTELILVGECAVHPQLFERLGETELKSSLVLCFCPNSVNHPKIVKKIADLIEQLCVHHIQLILAKESCCQIGTELIEKTKAILGDYELQFEINILNRF